MFARIAVALAVPTLAWLAFLSPAAAQHLAILQRDVREIEALARADSNDAEMQYYLALAHWKRRHWAQADSLLRLAIQLNPRHAEAYLALYHLPFSRRPSLSREVGRRNVPRDWQAPVEEARRFYQRAIRINPLVSQRVISVAYEIEEPRFEDFTSPLYREYELYYAWFIDLGLGRYGQVYERLERLGQREYDERRRPDKVPDFVLWYRGLAAAQTLRHDAAIRDIQALLDRALKEELKDELVHVPLRTNEFRFTLAVLHHLAGRADRAVELYQEAVQHDLGLVMAHTYMATIYDQAGFADRSLAERQRAAAAGEDDPVALFDYGAALFNEQRTAEAEEPTRRAVDLNPRYAPAHYLLGRVVEELGRPGQAREAYTRFLTVAPNSLKDLAEDARRRLATLP